MDNIKDYDDDGFELQFDEKCSPEERRYYVKVYPNVNMVADRRIHCTACNKHIGTAPSNETKIFMHPVLRVTQCRDCNKFYNSGEFEKGEDGSELYCRWCGQGGDVYCCSSCPFVFCKKCILLNLTRVVVNEITNNDNWKCFSCAPKIMWHLRAQHWALVNFIRKQKLKIDLVAKRGERDHDEIVDAMNTDLTTCCKSKMRMRNSESCATKKKRRIISDDSDTESSDDEGTRRSRKQASKKKRKLSTPPPPTTNQDKNLLPMLASNSEIEISKASSVKNKQNMPKPSSAPPQPQPEKSNELICTPDLFQFLNNHSFHQAEVGQSTANDSSTCLQMPLQVPQQTTITAIPNGSSCMRNKSSATATSNALSSDVMSMSQEPPPLLIRNVLSGSDIHAEFLPAANNINSSTVNRPPSRTQSQAANSNQQHVVKRVQRIISGQPVYHMINGYRVDLNSAAQQNTYRLPNGKVIHVRKQITGSDNQAGSRPNHIPVRASASSCSSNLISQVNALSQNVPLYRQMRPSMAAMQNSLPMSRQRLPMQPIPNQSAQISTTTPNNTQSPQPRLYGNNPVGVARTQLEQQIFNGIDICHHIDGKLKTLMNSNAYKNVRNFNDIKQLYIHLSYLFTYTIGRFRTLQEKCIDDMKKLGFTNDANSLLSGNVIDKYGSDCDEDEIEVVEPQHDTIDIADSDDEQNRSPEKRLTMESDEPTSDPKASNADKETDNMPPIMSSPVHEISTDTDLDITLLLQPQIILQDGSTEVHDEKEADEESDEIEWIDDVKLKSAVRVCLRPVELEYPELMSEITAEKPDEKNSNPTDGPNVEETDFESNTAGKSETINKIDTPVDNNSVNETIPVETMESETLTESNSKENASNNSSSKEIVENETLGNFDSSAMESNHHSESHNPDNESADKTVIPQNDEKQDTEKATDNIEELNDNLIKSLPSETTSIPIAETGLEPNSDHLDSIPGTLTESNTKSQEASEPQREENEIRQLDDGNQVASENTSDLIRNDHFQEMNSANIIDSLLDDRNIVTAEQRELLNDIQSVGVDLENISSPDTFDEYTKNGDDKKDGEDYLFTNVLDDLLSVDNVINFPNVN